MSVLFALLICGLKLMNKISWNF